MTRPRALVLPALAGLFIAWVVLFLAWAQGDGIDGPCSSHRFADDETGLRIIIGEPADWPPSTRCRAYSSMTASPRTLIADETYPHDRDWAIAFAGLMLPFGVFAAGRRPWLRDDDWLRPISVIALGAGGLWALMQVSLNAAAVEASDAQLLDCGVDLSRTGANLATAGACACVLAALVVGIRGRPRWSLRLIALEAVFVFAWVMLGGSSAAGCVE